LITSSIIYAGNEADILQFVNNTGFVFELAALEEKQYRTTALVVFAEHRYHGKSMPFGFGKEQSVVPGYNISLLTVEQALADYDASAVQLRTLCHMSDKVPFIAFGGSYGAWAVSSSVGVTMADPVVSSSSKQAA